MLGRVRTRKTLGLHKLEMGEASFRGTGMGGEGRRGDGEESRQCPMGEPIGPAAER